MSTQFWPWSAAATQRSIIRRYWRPAVIAAITTLTQGCTAVPSQQLANTQVSDPNTRFPPAGYRSVLGSYSSQRPVDPLPWTERNQSVTPQPKKDGQ